jgi:hypothetical protein
MQERRIMESLACLGKMKEMSSYHNNLVNCGHGWAPCTQKGLGATTQEPVLARGDDSGTSMYSEVCV